MRPLQLGALVAVADQLFVMAAVPSSNPAKQHVHHRRPSNESQPFIDGTRAGRRTGGSARAQSQILKEFRSPLMHIGDGTDTEFSHVIPRHDVISADPLKLIKAIPIASHFTESALKTLVEKNEPLSLRIAMDVEAMEPLETPPPVSRRAIIVKTLLVVAGIVGGAVMFV